ncbi:MAG: M20/M25/M40 family metallo-hydrolase [Kordiimonadaceae bacterium]|nr:M20/M25/M40 family metallo-hydrolase [Kordiimonadaceae bacterium]MBT6035719.1 M20/M25/M40 family metallo-hydrolase [Kordiimonadaceae bacterium]MBT6330556.1 M20/M25/M40 family metallo-hydrolase [Kordiimonadaceae bacterium]
MFIRKYISLLIFIFLASTIAKAQSSDVETLSSWVALDAPTGHEQHATDYLTRQFSGWSVDRHGNMSKSVGTGAPHQVVACALDAPSFAVTQITDDGYLRLHHIGRAPSHPLWSQAHAGQQLRIMTRQGPLVGVTAFDNNHFSNLHRGETAIIRADDLWIDVGASSAEEVAEMGIALLDPVIRHIPAWSYSDEIAGPNSGARVGCAAVIAGAQAGISGEGTTTWMLSAQNVFGWVGLSSALVALENVDEVILLDKGSENRRNETVDGINGSVNKILKYTGVSKVQILAPNVSEPAALMEHIKLAEAENLLNSVIALVDPTAPTPPWIKAPMMPEALNAEPGRLAGGSEMAEFEKLLDSVAETAGVFGHEGPIRAMVRAEMPGWAQEIAQTDETGNLWLDMGPRDQKATVFIAHMDEVGFEIEAIGDSGVVQLNRRGGMVTPAWEGQPALLHLDAGIGAKSLENTEHLKGIYLSRSEPSEKYPNKVEAWFGMDGAALKAAGVTVGMSATGYKEGHRMGKYRYSARGLDDRVGISALFSVLQDIDPDQLEHRIIFAWSVREEGGLVGANALADIYGAQSIRAYSIDTFVSSDTPLESPHFAYAPLGDGPVLRSIENSGMARPDELDRNRSIAENAGIKYQYGLTQGGTDGTAFTFWGAPNSGLSWPGRYSHGPAEMADLRDVAGLVKLIRAMALAAP